MGSAIRTAAAAPSPAIKAARGGPVPLRALSEVGWLLLPLRFGFGFVRFSGFGFVGERNEMAASDVEYRCFVGGLAWATDDNSLHTAFSTYGEVLESKVRPSQIRPRPLQIWPD
jgi:hypothetical protein